jgi:PIN domain nuclease of toxin-antitoxin system
LIRFVLDASALIAFMRDEAGGDRVAEAIEGSAISSVNLSEVGARFSDWGYKVAEVLSDIRTLPLQILSFDAAQAEDASLLRAATKSAGLSLGDRACLAAAKNLSALVLTADRAWACLEVGVPIKLIR